MPHATRVYLDLTHLGRHVTGIERISIEQFEKVTFEGADVRPVRSTGLVSMVVAQQFWLPLLALFHPSALFVFPGFPPSPLFALARRRVVFYVHDLFLITRRQDLSAKARLYLAWPFRFAITRLKYFLANSATTRSQLAPFVPHDAAIALYRPVVTNVFGLESKDTVQANTRPAPLRIITLGTIEPRKNYPFAAAIRDRLERLGYAGAELHIIGREGWGDDAARLRSRPNVHLHGYLPAAEIKRLLESASLYLCTSHEEGLGLPLLEAQFAGLLVAAPDMPVFREVLGGSGLFIDSGDADAAARAIVDRLSLPDWRTKARDAAAANLARWNASAAEDRRRAERLFASSLSQAMQRATTPAVET